MRPEKFGDSYDFVKRDIIHWLPPPESGPPIQCTSVRDQLQVSLTGMPSSWGLPSPRERQRAGIWSPPSAEIASDTCSSIQTPDYGQGKVTPRTTGTST